MNKTVYLIVILIGFPGAGLILGYLFFKLMGLVNGPLNTLALEISLVVWGGGGLITGIYGAISFLKIVKSNPKT